MTASPCRPSSDHIIAAEKLLAPPSETGLTVALWQEIAAAFVQIGLLWTVLKVRDFFLEFPTLLPDNTLSKFVHDINPDNFDNTELQEHTHLLPELIWELLCTLECISSTRPVTITLDNAKSRHAILFVPSRLDQHDLSELTFAVPVALAAPSAACVRRLWILEKSKVSNTNLALVGQGYYFGDILGVYDQVSYVRSVTVVGRWQEDISAYDSAEEWLQFDSDIEEGDLAWDSDGGRRDGR